MSKPMDPSLEALEDIARQKQDQRVPILNEISSTENSYLAGLQSIIDHKADINALLQKANGLTNHQKQTINKMIELMEDICRINEEMAREFNQFNVAMNEGNVDKADAALKGISGLNKLSVIYHAKYASVYQLEFAQMVSNTENKALKSFLRELDKIKISNKATLQFTNLAITPAQRMPRYILLFSDLLKHTENTHPNFQSISRLKEEFVTSTNKVDRTIANDEYEVLMKKGKLSEAVLVDYGKKIDRQKKNNQEDKHDKKLNSTIQKMEKKYPSIKDAYKLYEEYIVPQKIAMEKMTRAMNEAQELPDKKRHKLGELNTFIKTYERRFKDHPRMLVLKEIARQVKLQEKQKQAVDPKKAIQEAYVSMVRQGQRAQCKEGMRGLFIGGASAREAIREVKAKQKEQIQKNIIADISNAISHMRQTKETSTQSSIMLSELLKHLQRQKPPIDFVAAVKQTHAEYDKHGFGKEFIRVFTNQNQAWLTLNKKYPNQIKLDELRDLVANTLAEPVKPTRPVPVIETRPVLPPSVIPSVANIPRPAQMPAPSSVKQKVAKKVHFDEAKNEERTYHLTEEERAYKKAQLPPAEGLDDDFDERVSAPPQSDKVMPPSPQLPPPPPSLTSKAFPLPPPFVPQKASSLPPAPLASPASASMGDFANKMGQIIAMSVPGANNKLVEQATKLLEAVNAIQKAPNVSNERKYTQFTKLLDSLVKMPEIDPMIKDFAKPPSSPRKDQQRSAFERYKQQHGHLPPPPPLVVPGQSESKDKKKKP